MIADPAVRKDGLCACGCGKTRPIATKDVKLQRRLRRYAGDQAVSDPFATSRCARRYHGCEIDGERGVDDEILDRRAEAARQGRALSRGQFEDPVLA
jgi:hypothetical protein